MTTTPIKPKLEPIPPLLVRMHMAGHILKELNTCDDQTIHTIQQAIAQRSLDQLIAAGRVDPEIVRLLNVLFR